MKKASQTPQFASADFLVYRDTWPDNDFAQLYVIYPNFGGAQARQSDLTRHRRAPIATRLMRAAVQLLTDRDRFKAKIPARFTGDIQDEQ